MRYQFRLADIMNLVDMVGDNVSVADRKRFTDGNAASSYRVVILCVWQLPVGSWRFVWCWQGNHL